MRHLIVLALFLLTFSVGCSKPSQNVAGPVISTEGAVPSDAVFYYEGTTKFMYTAEGTVICDYPLNFIGPIPCGHAYTNGTYANYCAGRAPTLPSFKMTADADGIVIK